MVVMSLTVGKVVVGDGNEEYEELLKQSVVIVAVAVCTKRFPKFFQLPLSHDLSYPYTVATVFREISRKDPR